MKRYELYETEWAVMDEDPDGKWVKWEDVKKTVSDLFQKKEEKKAMITKHKFFVTVEIQAERIEEEKELLKKFENGLYQQYGGNEITRITEIKGN